MPELPALLTAIAEMTEEVFFVYGLVFLRAGAAVSLIPAFGEQFVPMRVRLAIAICLTMAVTPLVSDILPSLSMRPINLTWVIVVETLSGLMIGLVLRLLIIALQLAGTIAAQSASITQFAGVGITPDPMPAIGNLLTIGGLTLAVILGLHVKIVAALAFSYTVLPPAGLPAATDLADWGLAHIVRAFVLAFSLAAPFVLASLLYNLCLGAINKAMPQLMVAFVGAPVITGGSLVILFLASPLILTLWHQAFEATLANPLSLP